MKNLFRRLKAAWLYSQHMPYYELPEGFWTEADARAWSIFLASNAGSKIKYILRNAVVDSALYACNSAQQRDYHCGWARGVSATVALLEAHEKTISHPAAQAGGAIGSEGMPVDLDSLNP